MQDDHLKELNHRIKAETEKYNRTPVADFDFLSPIDMHNLAYKTLEPDCPVRFKEKIDDSVLDRIPFLKMTEHLMKKIDAEGALKLTKTGNLPVKIVKELYDLGLIKEDMIEKGIQKLYKEKDSLSITNVKLILELSGLTKKKTGKLSLTKKGEKLLKPENRNALLQEIFKTYGIKFNLGYHDGYEDEGSVQTLFGYTLYQLLLNGDENGSTRYYSTKMLTAHPDTLVYFDNSSIREPVEQFHSCYKVRYMQRFLNWFNLVEYSEERFSGPSFVQTVLMKEVFEIREENLRYIKQEFTA